tara:strand:- start:382 stop:756 length:375 start_codon:yes stop_codon:yes gene_type:complete
MTQYNPKNIEETLKRMEKSDELKGIYRTGTNIMSFFDDNDKEHELQKQQSLAEIKRDEYLKSVELLKKLIQENGTQIELTRIMAIGYLIESTDFLNMPSDVKKTLKENMTWCNKQYEKYVDTTK